MKDKFEYDSLTGLIRWVKGNCFVKAGSVAGSFNAVHGNIYVSVDKEKVPAAEVALILNDIEFTGPVYHKNGCAIDNRLENLVYNKRAVKAGEYLRRNGNGNKWVVEVGEYPHKQFINKVDAVNYRNRELAKDDSLFIPDTSLNGMIKQLNTYVSLSVHYSNAMQGKIVEYVRDKAMKANLSEILSVDTDALKSLAKVIDGDIDHIKPHVIDMCSKMTTIDRKNLILFVAGIMGENSLLVRQAVDDMIANGELIDEKGTIKVKK
ncbi:homing endonuclease [Yersinia phage vB_YenM_636]|nr:homing endonuclease [Yersinia phage vB_YenM_12]QKN86433.1 homing endonuclease [Yersinia phage vB_YenM_22]QKN86524.1 homing endonuclease [Yersinia phage vB_YenM_25]QKN86615.1 homing endonuclease [Yersinia phage vB_YenM_27]QKN86706.1 homing endonuclease [Yersinia phage vB_YenM_39]QKN86797.1 homing endonuclease [Yersinia phage vB_YenM_126]QKN86888.1 homing endonuclease [Yersinia phage vB_YenM_526-1]QKN86979.1 homing endonuclease [Yersinia phage vB_YenM_526-2]QKN87071.1 homing endonuclease [